MFDKEKFSTDVFIAGQDGIHTYRIPVLVSTMKGIILAFSEARRNTVATARPTVIALKRSFDEGKTWGSTQFLGVEDEKRIVINPCVVVEKKKNNIFLFYIKIEKNKEVLSNRIKMLKSTDEGLSWSKERSINLKIKGYNFVPGPGVGIQLQGGNLIIPGYVLIKRVYRQQYSMVLYSDDLGESWHPGEHVRVPTSESQVVELKNGLLMLNMRNNCGRSHRIIALSSDKGRSWDRIYDEPSLNECPCQASLIRYKDYILFCNPNSKGLKADKKKRHKLTLYVSRDEGKTWTRSNIIESGVAAYSSLVVTEKENLLCLYETSKKRFYDRICLKCFSK
ncbi:MAG: sialidase family protein [Candidatus Heimdallarchaeaceae archaeon]